jgi:hypothetical protein
MLDERPMIDFAFLFSSKRYVGVTVQAQKKTHTRFLRTSQGFALNNAAKIESLITSFHRDALLSHNCCDKLGGCDIKAGVIDPI